MVNASAGAADVASEMHRHGVSGLLRPRDSSRTLGRPLFDSDFKDIMNETQSYARDKTDGFRAVCDPIV